MVVAREPRANAAFLRLPRSQNHHDLGLFGIGAGAPPRAPGTVGLYHLAWQVDTIDELAALRSALVEAGSLVGESNHGVSYSLYAHDPSGNEFEVMWALPQADWGIYATDAVVERLDMSAPLAQYRGGHTITEDTITQDTITQDTITQDTVTQDTVTLS